MIIPSSKKSWRKACCCATGMVLPFLTITIQFQLNLNTTTTAITTCNLAFLGSTLLRTQASPNATAQSYFGYSVAISDSYYSAAAFGETSAGSAYSGNAYIFNRSDGSLKHTLVNPNVDGTSQDDRFGRSLVMNDTYTLVATYSEDYGSYINVGARR